MFRRALVLGFVIALCASASATAAPPGPSFFGVMVDGPMLDDPRVDLDAQMADIAASGIGFVRVGAYWDEVQPAPLGPMAFGRLDRLVVAAARHHLGVLPVVLRAPGWAAANPGAPFPIPRDPAAYATLIRALVGRYGPAGSLWRERPDLPTTPITRWQIWNEPDSPATWGQPDWAAGYVTLLRVARAALRSADPAATLVLAGLTNHPEDGLERLYAAGARGLFDVAAVHAFRGRTGDVVATAVLVRRVLDRHGDTRVGVISDEVSYTSPGRRPVAVLGIEGNELHQARRAAAVVRKLVRNRGRIGLIGMSWYTWLSPLPGSRYSFDYGGLRRLDAAGRAVDKPALASFAAALRAAQEPRQPPRAQVGMP